MYTREAVRYFYIVDREMPGEIFYIVYKGILKRFLHCIQENAWEIFTLYTREYLGDFYIVYREMPGEIFTLYTRESLEDFFS